MKRISTLVVGLSLLASSALYASDTDHTGDHMHNGTMTNHSYANGMTNMNMKKMDHGTMSAYNNMMMTDGYEVTLSSIKPLTDGKNHMMILLKKEGKAVSNADVKIKFSMPIMPGMEFSETAKAADEKYNCNIDFSMQGEWAYELEFKTSDGKMHMTKGSVNL